MSHRVSLERSDLFDAKYSKIMIELESHKKRKRELEDQLELVYCEELDRQLKCIENARKVKDLGTVLKRRIKIMEKFVSTFGKQYE